MFLLHYNKAQEQRKKNSKLQMNIMKGKICGLTKVLSYIVIAYNFMLKSNKKVIDHRNNY